MKLQEIYQLVVSLGIAADPRGPEGVQQYLKQQEQYIVDLKPENRWEFDQERLVNPFSDTRILWGDPEKEVKGVFVGIDMEVGEVLLADRLAAKGQPVDLVMSHHPEGCALAALHHVMHVQEDMLYRMGVPVNVAEGIMAGRINEVKRGLAPVNHYRAVDAARLLGLPFMCVHTPADNHVNTYLEKRIAERQPVLVSDVIKLLLEIPEYQVAASRQAGPVLFAGKQSARCGKVMVDMTGGTSGSEDAYARLSQAGVGTVVVMHMGEKHRKEAEKHHINVIVAGHMASDSLGMNLVLDVLEQRGLEISPCAGLIRLCRNSEGKGHKI
ncbi:MAG: NGG1p interacting factor NIF3 [Heliobacteriaceae bacterium]|nr:NGG1p interacting factor NIF3 [Heliobacteriaceae bacterium]MDD4587562.1 NGG1p interacting factor NIF3 [Heliobacteriaceae bacterium]